MYDKVIKILLVEDDEDDYVLTRQLLSEIENGRFELTWVATYREALEVIAQSRHDVCLIDYRLGEHDGVELLNVSRASGIRMPTILLTGQDDHCVDLKAMQAGVSDYLLKNELNKNLLERSIRYAVEHNRALEALRQSEIRYRRIVETTNEGIWMLDAEARTSYANPRLAEMLGYSTEEMLGRCYFDFMDEETRLRAEERLKRCRKGLAEQYELQLRHSDGRRRWFSISANPILSNAGEFINSLKMVTDITERKRAEELLREADRRAIKEYECLVERIATLAQALGAARNLKTIYQATSDFASASTDCTGIVISLYDQEAKILTTAYARSHGREVEAQMMSDDGIVSESGETQERESPQSSLNVQMAIMGRTIGAIEIRSTRPSAFTREHTVAMQMAANLTASAIENVGLIEKERISMEQLRQAQRMEAVGRLAGGVAHDFNNLLTAITGYSALMLRQTGPGDPQHHNLAEIKKAGERAAALTRQLLAFSRRQVLNPKILNLNLVITEMERMLGRLISEDIDIRLKLSPDTGQIRADPGQIEQVIVNLVVNARDAMPGGGKLTIETSNIYLNKEYASQHIAVIPGYYVMLAVSDTGVGMDEKTRAHIFEPFFTTKETSKGTGLGLSTVYGIIKQSGGNIWVYSEVGQGTTFKIYLPQVYHEAEPHDAPSRVEGVTHGTGTILLVEDDELVRGITRHTLQMFGYKILEAVNGEDALRLVSQHEQIDMVLTDVVMPKMNGRQLVERLKVLRPHVKVLYMSGYTEDAIKHHGALGEGTAFIEKPFSPDKLGCKVKEVLSNNA